MFTINVLYKYANLQILFELGAVSGMVQGNHEAKTFSKLNSVYDNNDTTLVQRLDSYL